MKRFICAIFTAALISAPSIASGMEKPNII